MKLTEVKFKKRFCVNYYRNLTLPMGEMSFHKNWVTAGKRGDPYPLVKSVGDVTETVASERYSLCGPGEVRRVIGAYFPWLTYDIGFESLSGTLGFVLSSPLGEAEITLSSSGEVKILTPNGKYEKVIENLGVGTLSVSFRGIGASVFFVKDGVHTLLLDAADAFFESLMKESVFSDTKTELIFSGESAEISRVTWYLSAGISQADLRPMKYEDGTPIIEGGRLFVTATARSVEYKYQVVLSWCPTACDFKLEGALFFDMGDGYLGADVASSVVYDRCANEWKIAMCAFSRGHVVGLGKSISDPRFGINIIDIKTLTPANGECDRYNFVGFDGDEDPDFILVDGKWYFSICRGESDGYHYYHFVSDDFKSFKFVARTDGHDKTGGSYIRTEEGVYFACGSDFKKRAVYDLYTLDNLSTPVCNLSCDYDDGGFRGWGSIVMIPCGSRYRYVWITFDRHLGSHFNWSYGNIHVFESESFKPSKI